MNAAMQRRPRQIAGIYRPPVTNRPPPPPPRPGPLAQLFRTANTIRAHLEHTVLRDEGMTWTTYDVLVLICARRVIDTRTTAVEIGIAKATLTNTVGLLVDRGLVRRNLHEHDRRRVVLRPTPEGVDLARRIQGRVDAEQTRLLATAGISSGDGLARALRQLATTSRAHKALTKQPGAGR
ncbi:MarR family transcriptional regulator [Micromonospora sp. C51]|uniref:MarR family winged helix-turn-helix transcriptional regulator n=1 Tax=Micromonospora sp. C51 TaxID=2824879 RepID=UPI001B374100|nr:MarR family transcriptional regulator [Micromonospora sp. C51]MBQ1052177.1 MarR family transcriptional regulator [Micromonospora sp. C51]